MSENHSELTHKIVMKHGEGWSIRALSRHFGMGRNSIRRILRGHGHERDAGHDLLDKNRGPKRSSSLSDFVVDL